MTPYYNGYELMAKYMQKVGVNDTPKIRQVSIKKKNGVPSFHRREVASFIYICAKAINNRVWNLWSTALSEAGIYSYFPHRKDGDLETNWNGNFWRELCEM